MVAPADPSPMCPLFLLALHLQTIKGNKIAKSTTREEFTDIMKKLVVAAREKLANIDPKLKPIFSYDNNKIQKGASLAEMGITPEEKLELPPYSPDMHKVIEHVFAILKGQLQEEMLKNNPARMDPAVAQKMVRVYFKHNISKKSIRADVDSLPVTWHIISTLDGVFAEGPDGRMYWGTGGDWADTSHR
jgi:hypothetical protein